MSIRSSVLVIADTLAEVAAIDSSAPVVFCLETGRFRVKNGSWGDAFANDLNSKCSSTDARLSDARTPLSHTHTESDITALVTDLAGKCANNDARLLTSLNRIQRIFRSSLPMSGTFLLVSGTAYFVYLGRTTQAITPKFVELQVTTAGAGAQTAEVGLFSTPNPPSKAAQSLTKLVSTGTVDALTSTGVKRNTSAFATQIAAGVHLWAAIRTAMATTQPTIGPGLAFDRSQGNLLTLAASGVLTGTGPFSGVIPAVSAANTCPDLTVALD